MSFLDRFRARKEKPTSGREAVKQEVRKAVFPVAGLGTRFLPATKAIPKEMLPIVDRPLVQYAVDEAVAAGIEEMIFVTHRSKRAIEDHFDRAIELERELEMAGKDSLLEQLRSVTPSHIRFSFARQTAPLGLGHAVWCARHLIGNEPFAVVLPDDLLDANPPVLAQMVDCFHNSHGSVIAVDNVRREDTGRYGIVEPSGDIGRVTRIRGIVEKPQPESAPSTMAVVGRYVFSPRILGCLDGLEPGAGNEIQLTDGIARLLADEPVFAYSYIGKRYDCGSKLGYLEATVDFALKDPQLGAAFQQIVNRAADVDVPVPAVVNASTTDRGRQARHLTLVSH